MTSPLDVPNHTAVRQLNEATRRFTQSTRDHTLSTYAALALIVATFFSIGFHGFDALQVVVVAGAVALASVTRARRDRLERKMWWHQARLGLVNALAEQRVRAPELDVIDLRDSAIDTEQRQHQTH